MKKVTMTLPQCEIEVYPVFPDIPQMGGYFLFTANHVLGYLFKILSVTHSLIKPAGGHSSVPREYLLTRFGDYA